jgi:ATP-dependent helicase HrpB
MAAWRSPSDTGLPVETAVAALREALGTVGRAVLSAPPGSGKTTVVPLRLLDEPWLAGRRIVVLEPRRLAARAAAKRMADLLGEPVGATVGYRTRLDRAVGPDTRIEVVTEGILTRRLLADPALPGIGLVLLDEFHERNLPGDLALALLLAPGRAPDPRLVVMSATLDVDRLAVRLGVADRPAPVVVATGRQHDVEIRWEPRLRRQPLEDAVDGAVRRALASEEGDVLVFLPGVGEIRRAAERLLGAPLPGRVPVEVVELHGSLPAAEQDRAVAPCPPGTRKVVLSTDVAETSLTVEGVRVVVDAGLARIARHDPAVGFTRLVTEAASRASADQRAGRAGRVAPGVAVRLWSTVEHAPRPAFRPPEVTVAELSDLMLSVAVFAGSVTAVDALGWLDPPPPAAVRDAVSVLGLLDAIDASGQPTALGRAMAALPLPPRLARMVVATASGPDGPTACALAALLEDRDVLRGRPDEVPAELALRLRLFADPTVRHRAADGASLARARASAADLARRAGVVDGPVDPDAAGRVLVWAEPDRLAAPRAGARGQFRLAGGRTGWVEPESPLAGAPLLVVADIDPRGKSGRIRRAAPVTPAEVLAVREDRLVERATLRWDGDELMEKVELREGEVVVAVLERWARPGDATARALAARAKRDRLASLHWTDVARSLQETIVERRRAERGWPDVTDAALASTVDRWLVPRLADADGLASLAAVDLHEVLWASLSDDQRDAIGRRRFTPG